MNAVTLFHMIVRGCEVALVARDVCEFKDVTLAVDLRVVLGLFQYFDGSFRALYFS